MQRKFSGFTATTGQRAASAGSVLAEAISQRELRSSRMGVLCNSRSTVIVGITVVSDIDFMEGLMCTLFARVGWLGWYVWVELLPLAHWIPGVRRENQIRTSISHVRNGLAWKCEVWCYVLPAGPASRLACVCAVHRSVANKQQS